MVLIFLLLIGLFGAGMRACRTGYMFSFDKEAVLPLRGILVLLVVVGHSLAAVGLGKYGLEFQAVAVFFFISGYGLMQKRLRANGNPLYGGFRHAAVKLLPAFLIASATYMVYGSFVGWGDSLLCNIVEGSSSLPIPFTWYVLAIFALYGVFYLSDRICREDRAMLVCVTIGVVFYWVLTALVFKWPFYWWKAVGGFVAGIVFAKTEGRLKGVIVKSPSKVLIIAGGALLGIYGLDSVAYFPIRFLADHLFLAVLGPVVALVMYGIRIPKSFGLLGVVSYEMYIVHGAFVRSPLHDISNALCYVCVIVLCSAVSGAALHWCVKGVRLKA